MAYFAYAWLLPCAVGGMMVTFRLDNNEPMDKAIMDQIGTELGVASIAYLSELKTILDKYEQYPREMSQATTTSIYVLLNSMTDRNILDLCIELLHMNLLQRSKTVLNTEAVKDYINSHKGGI